VVEFVVKLTLIVDYETDVDGLSDELSDLLSDYDVIIEDVHEKEV